MDRGAGHGPAPPSYDRTLGKRAQVRLCIKRQSPPLCTFRVLWSPRLPPLECATSPVALRARAGGWPLPRALLGCNILPHGCAPHRRRDSPHRLPQDAGGSQWETPIVIITSTPIFYSNSLRLFSPEAKLFKPATLSYPDAGINSALGVRLLFERTVDSPSNSGFTHGVNPLLRPYL